MHSHSQKQLFKNAYPPTQGLLFLLTSVLLLLTSTFLLYSKPKIRNLRLCIVTYGHLKVVHVILKFMAPSTHCGLLPVYVRAVHNSQRCLSLPEGTHSSDHEMCLSRNVDNQQ